MQSVDDEIPDLSGPVSLGTYTFKLPSRGNRYETHRLSELQNSQDKEGEDNVAGSAPTLSAYPPSHQLLPPTRSSFQTAERPNNQTGAELDSKKFSSLNNPSLDRRDPHETGPHQHPYGELNLSYPAANFSNSVNSIYTDRQSTQASRQARSSFLSSQGQHSSQGSRVWFKARVPSLEASEQTQFTFPADPYGSILPIGTTTNPDRDSSQSAFGQANSSIPTQDHSSHLRTDGPINPDGQNPQAGRVIYPSLPPPYHQLDTYLNHVISPESDGSSSRASAQVNYPQITQRPASEVNYPHITQRPRSEPHQRSDSKADEFFETRRQSCQATSQPQFPTSPNEDASPRSLVFSDSLPTASFNLDTNHWDPDLPEAKMSTHTPANSSSRGGHSGMPSTRNSSIRMTHPNPNVRNPHAIVTTTKSGRPYTNPYMPIEPPPSATRQVVRESSSRLTSQEEQSEETEPVQLEGKTRYIDQEEARYQALEHSNQGPAQGSLEDPFQDQTTPTQQYGRDQSSNYADFATFQAAYGDLAGYPPTATSYASGPNAPSFYSDVQDTTPTLRTGPSPYHSQRRQRSAYEQQPDAQDTTPTLRTGPSPYHSQRRQRSAYEQQPPAQHRVQNSGAAPHGQQSFANHGVQNPGAAIHEQQSFANLRVHNPNAALHEQQSVTNQHVQHPGAAQHEQQFFANPHIQNPGPAQHEQQFFANPRVQNPGAAPREQRPAYGETNPRAAVRLPAVRGTTEQSIQFSQYPSLASLSLEDPAGNNTQGQHHRHAQGSVPPASGSTRVSHAIPIRDPAAYTGSGLTTRRNQEALRQNLSTVVASSQGPTGPARTVMNDPQRDRQPSSRPSSTATDTTVTGSTLRAQAPSYESITTQRFKPSGINVLAPLPRIRGRNGQAGFGENLRDPTHFRTENTLESLEHVGSNTEGMYRREAFQAPGFQPGLEIDAAMHTKNAGLPVEAIPAGNAFMNALASRKPPPKLTPEQELEDAAAWFRKDSRALSHAAAILPYETMNRMNPERFPLEDRTPRSVGQLANDSQDDDPRDRARQAATPRPIGHGRPAGQITPPDNQGPKRTAPQAPFSTLSGVTSVNDKEGMERSGRQFLEDDAKAIEAMIGGVYDNLMTAKTGPYDYLNHYSHPPAYAIDHNPQNNNTLFDPQWFATAPPARVGRDPRREQGEYEDPTQGSAGRRGDHARGDVRRDSGGRGGSGARGWGRN